MNVYADWTPLLDYIKPNNSSRSRAVFIVLFGLAAGLAAGQIWLGIDPYAKLGATMLLVGAPPALIAIFAPRSWPIGNRELLAAATSTAATFGAWTQVARYLEATDPAFWLWPASFVFLVIILGAFQTIMSTALSEAITDG